MAIALKTCLTFCPPLVGGRTKQGHREILGPKLSRAGVVPYREIYVPPTTPSRFASRLGRLCSAALPRGEGRDYGVPCHAQCPPNNAHTPYSGDAHGPNACDLGAKRGDYHERVGASYGGDVYGVCGHNRNDLDDPSLCRRKWQYRF